MPRRKLSAQPSRCLRFALARLPGFAPRPLKTIHRIVFRTRLRVQTNRKTKIKPPIGWFYFGAEGGTRTHTLSPTTDFESVTSANSITSAQRDYSSISRTAFASGRTQKTAPDKRRNRAGYTAEFAALKHGLTNGILRNVNSFLRRSAVEQTLLACAAAFANQI